MVSESVCKFCINMCKALGMDTGDVMISRLGLRPQESQSPLKEQTPQQVVSATGRTLTDEESSALFKKRNHGMLYFCTNVLILNAC